MSDSVTQPVHPTIQKAMSPTEFANTMSHFHRAEIARMAGWRDRLDRTTNWALTVAAAMLSVSLSTSSAHHSVIIFAMLIVLLLLWIEARRYRFFDFYRARVRQFERHYFAQIFSPQPDFASNWLSIVGESLRAPRFLMTHRVAFARRLRRNYIYMFIIMLLAWGIKIATPSLQVEGGPTGFRHSLIEALNNASIGPIPGWLTSLLIGVFYSALIAIALSTKVDDGELLHGSVHV